MDRAHVVLIGMAFHADKLGLCATTSTDLAKWCRISLSAVRRATIELLRLGEIQTAQTARGRSVPNTYLVTLLKPLTVSSFSHHKAAQGEHL